MHAWVEIDLDAIRENVRAIRSAVRFTTGFIAMVKGNAYGHGAVEVGRVAIEAGASHLGVAFPSEGLELRRADITAPILVLGSFCDEDLEDIITYRLTVAVPGWEMARRLAERARTRGRRVPVHVEVDTGMGRLGVDWKEAPALVKRLTEEHSLAVEGIYTHFATADEEDNSYTRLQLQRFQQTVSELDRIGIFVPLRHHSNSAGVLRFPGSVQDAVRPGLAIYGLYPSAHVGRRIELKPALSFRSRVVLVKEVPRGAFISYGRTYRAPAERRIATISVGYADGYPRGLSNRACVLVRGHRCPVVGTVTMDHIMAELGDSVGPVEAGDVVTLIGADGGDRIAAEELAQHTGTISYEITTRISSRAQRLYRGARPPAR